MSYVELLENRILGGEQINKEEASRLYYQPLEELCNRANAIREHMCSNSFDLCTIINGKSGNCSEDCKFCAQSICSHTKVDQYPLRPVEELVAQAKMNYEQGVLRYSIVTSGKALSDREIDKLCKAIRRIRDKVGISVCISPGLLCQNQYLRLKEAGATRIHNNLETSESFFPHVCTTHTFQEKKEAIRAAQAAGLSVCSGGIMGLGETIKDRIDMAFTLRELGVKSVPINMLNPIPGTPFENHQKLTCDDMRRIVATYRFILPDASIRLAGGRGLLEDKGRSCFLSGANAAISGDMLTTSGITIETDIHLLHELGYEAKCCDE